MIFRIKTLWMCKNGSFDINFSYIQWFWKKKKKKNRPPYAIFGSILAFLVVFWPILRNVKFPLEKNTVGNFFQKKSKFVLYSKKNSANSFFLMLIQVLNDLRTLYDDLGILFNSPLFVTWIFSNSLFSLYFGSVLAYFAKGVFFRHKKKRGIK